MGRALAGVTVLAAMLASCFRDPDAGLRESLRPAALEAPEPPARPVEARTYMVRVWATAGYRREARDWQQRFGDLLRRAERITAPAFGVRFAVAEYREWDAEPAGQAADALDALEALDAGEDVDWVVGLMAALPVVTSSQHQLGAARYFSRHIVMRGLHDVAEYDALAASLTHTDVADRDALYHQRLEHKALTLFLHEWAHTLGAPHVRDTEDILSPVYDHRASFFAPRVEGILRRVLAERALEVRDEAKLVADLRAAMEGWDGWDPVDRGHYLAMLGERKAQERQADELKRLAAASDAALRKGDVTAALAAIDRLRAAMGPSPAAAQWAYLVRAYQAGYAVSRAEAALAHLPAGAEAEALGAANVRLRRRFGLPPRAERFGVRADDEPAFVSGVVAALDALAEGDGAAAAPPIEALAKRFGDAPGVLVVRCQLEVVRGRRREAAALCRQALERWEETVFAYGWLAALAFEDGRAAEAAAHLERLVVLDPEQRTAWMQLLAAYEALGDVRAAAGVRARYAARFGARPP